MGMIMLPNGCSWHETHRLGGCLRLEQPRPECTADRGQPATHARHHRLAIIVPYRGRAQEFEPADLEALCDRIFPQLASHRIGFQLFVANQVDHHPFNRGALANAAVAVLAQRSRAGDEGDAAAGSSSAPTPGGQRHRWAAFDYLAVHDADRFPLPGNRSGCAAATSSYYTYPSRLPRVLHPMSYAGGVLLVPLHAYRAVNGFSNSYWGWGEEDNDLFIRLRWCGLPPSRAPRVEECMEHRDCALCQRQKSDVDAAALRAQTARFEQRLPHPRKHMLQDGLSTLNFTLRRRPRRLRCGRAHSGGEGGGAMATVLDVELRR